MRLESLSLKDFRVHTNFPVVLEKNIVGIVGANTSGKTSILEAIEILSRGKSSRAGRGSDVVKRDSSHSTIIGKLDSGVELFCYIEAGDVGQTKKVYKVNGVSKSLNNFSGNLTSVLFTPEDIRLILGSPSRRRDYLDSIFFQFDKEYKKTLGGYNRALKQANALIRLIQDGRARASDLDIWFDSLISNGGEITKKRADFFNEIGEFVNSSSNLLSDGWDMKVQYFPRQITKEKIKENINKIIASGHVLYGPHRDDYDFEVKLNGHNKHLLLKDFGSRGQQRVGALIFKLAELEYITFKTGGRPILLLDDVFSELDDVRRKKVLDYAKHQQTIITTTDKSNLKYFDDYQEVLLNSSL